MPDAEGKHDIPEIEIVKPAADGKNGENRMVLARDILPDQLTIIPIENRPFFPKMIAPILIESGPVKQAVARGGPVLLEVRRACADEEQARRRSRPAPRGKRHAQFRGGG